MLGVCEHPDVWNSPLMFEHFVEAQNPVYDTVLLELAAGEKRTHWIWFIFPQLRALGHSAMARRFGLENLSEARAYLAHPILGPRLIACTGTVNRLSERSAHDVFGSPDDLKFRSSMTLFAHAAPEELAFTRALAKYYPGGEDPLTLDVVG